MTNLTTKTMKELIATYNTLVAIPRKSFKNKATAIEAIEALLPKPTPITTPTKEATPMTDNNVMTDEDKAMMCGMMDTVQEEQQVADSNNPYLGFETPTPFARKQLISMVVPVYLRKKVELGGLSLPLDTVQVAKTAVVLRGMVDGVCSFAQAGRLITEEEALNALDFETKKAIKQNSRWGNINHTPEMVLDMAFLMNLINSDFTFTEKFLDMTKAKDTSYPHTEKQGRVQPFVKNNTRACKAVKSACNTLYEEKYKSHMKMHSLVTWIDDVWVNNFDNTATPQQRKLVKQLLQATKYVRAGVDFMGEEELMSQYDADNRGRLYHMACAGANPQASDEERSYYCLVNSGAGITKEHPSFKVFIDEVKDIGGGFSSDKMLRSIAQAPDQFLIKHLVAETTRAKEIEWNGEMVKVAKKPFTMVRLAWDWDGFKSTGVLHSSIGFGEDAKNSGTQYLAICAGSKDMAERTGLTNAEVKKADPYVKSAEVFVNMLKEGGASELFTAYINRAFIKTPYMAVQYGGGVNALTTSKDFINNLIDLDFDVNNPKKLKAFAKGAVTAINVALGPQITAFIENLQDAVEHALWAKAGFKFMTDDKGEVIHDEEGNPVKLLAEYLTYKHIDGFFVNHQTKPTETICKAFNINMGGGENGVKIADFGPKDGMYTINAKRPTGEEFIRTFVVNFIQGLDALVARTIINKCKEAGLQGINSIHDCFRTNLEDSHKLHNVIADAYDHIFIQHDVVEHLSAQLEKMSGKGIAPTPFAEKVVTKEILYSENAYYFCQ